MRRFPILSYIAEIALCASIAAPGCSAPPANKDGATGIPSGGTVPGSGATLRFEGRNEVRITIPERTGLVRVWCALPQDDANEKVERLDIQAPWPHRIEQDSEGNRVLYLEQTRPTAGDASVVTTFVLTRHEVNTDVTPSRALPLPPQRRLELARDLAPNQHVIINEEIRSLAHQVVGEETNTLLAARKLYDWTLTNVDYWVKDPRTKKASPVGSTEHCLTTRTGNCTDFHSLWTSLARAAGIPTRMVYGSLFKKELDGESTDQSYHCWPEFYVEGVGWVPHDVAIADIFAGEFPVNAENETLVRRTTADGYRGPDPKLVEYYFGNLDARRVVWSRGRDLLLEPRPSAGPVNALPKAYVELEGSVAPEGKAWKRTFTYKELRS